jgi:hypothetical protein
MACLATVEKYIASLPGGIGAYPDCARNGEAFSLWLQRSPTSGLADRVPAQVAALLASASELPTWVPEVHATVLSLAIREAHFADDASFLEHASACNRAVLQTPSNRTLFWVATPTAILRAAGLRWSALHRGSSVEVRIRSEVSAGLELRFPLHLFPEVVLRGTATGFAAVLENAGARDVVVDLRAVEPTRAVFAGHWR